ncbi:aspartate/glutamate racemase family protein [Streptomyces sp. NPDC001663]|uniref:aspartate/glutamate racemase family protein n=1 Tax=Streptomyces sp. NPDC001663 TaxID=3364597 RepID=UPI0036A73C9E
MKLLCIWPEPLDPASEHIALMAQAGQAIMRPGDSFTLLPIASGPSEYYESEVGFAMCVPGLLRAVLEHQDDHDAIFAGCAADPGLRAMRVIAKVPVVGAAESAAATAQLVSSRYGIVTILDEVVADLEGLWSSMEVRSRLVGTNAINLGLEEFTDLEQNMAAVQRCGEKLLAQGAQAIILGCLSFGLTHPSIAPLLSDRLGVPVIDPLRASVAAAYACETLGVRVSRRWVPPLPSFQDKTVLGTYLSSLPTAQQPAGV